MVTFVLDEYRVSIRRACKVIPFRRQTLYYRAAERDDEALRHRIKEIAASRVRYGQLRKAAKPYQIIIAGAAVLIHNVRGRGGEYICIYYFIMEAMKKERIHFLALPYLNSDFGDIG